MRLIITCIKKDLIKILLSTYLKSILTTPDLFKISKIDNYIYNYQISLIIQILV